MATQQEAIDLINSGENCFITGGAGRGKSWVIKQITNKNTILVAPTGVAALNIGGQTAHRTFGLPLGIATQDDMNKVSAKVKKLLSSKHLKRIVLDEAGMNRADYLDIIDHRLKQVRGNDLPFGGIQMIMVGDFFQLSPIVSAREASLYYQRYSTAYAFGANSWNFTTINLEESQRQADPIHVRVLDSFRTGDKWAARAFEWMNENCMPYDDEEDILHLCCYKADAESTNNLHYNQLDAVERLYKGSTNNIKWSNDIAVPQLIKMKVGAKVIIRANDPEGDYVNGQRGTVKEMRASSVVVTLEDGHDVEVIQFNWETYKYNATAKGLQKEVEFIYSQIPLSLGWAVTIHASQGLTLDRYAIDLGRGAFSAGQWYVAVSRARDLTKVSLASPAGMKDLIVDPQVKAFYGFS